MKRLNSCTKNLVLAVLLIAVCTSCFKDKDKVAEPSNPNDNELITTLKLSFVDQESGSVSHAAFRDIDGAGGANPVCDTIRLAPHKSYNVTLLLLDETKVPVDTVSEEVRREGDQHQFFFTAYGANISFAYADKDVNNVPLGLASVWETEDSTKDREGKVTIILKHQGAAKPKTGNGDASVGDTDIEVHFPVLIEGM